MQQTIVDVILYSTDNTLTFNSFLKSEVGFTIISNIGSIIYKILISFTHMLFLQSSIHSVNMHFIVEHKNINNENIKLCKRSCFPLYGWRWKRISVSSPGNLR